MGDLRSKASHGPETGENRGGAGRREQRSITPPIAMLSVPLLRGGFRNPGTPMYASTQGRQAAPKGELRASTSHSIWETYGQKPRTVWRPTQKTCGAGRREQSPHLNFCKVQELPSFNVLLSRGCLTISGNENPREFIRALAS